MGIVYMEAHVWLSITAHSMQRRWQQGQERERDRKESLGTRRKRPDWGAPVAPLLQSALWLFLLLKPLKWNSSLGNMRLGGEAPAWVQGP